MKNKSNKKFRKYPPVRRAGKLRVGVIFGGRSAEHEVSLVSATSIIQSLDRKKYHVTPIGISPSGKWFSSANVLNAFKSRNYNLEKFEVYLLPDPKVHGIVRHDRKIIPLDVIFPVLHGSFGEDGTIQGLFELANIPYVGAGVLGSSVGMDKVITKQLCEQWGIPVSPYIWFLKNEFYKNQRNIISVIEKEISYPCFIKPANLGSSVGISKASNQRQLIESIKLALKFDRKILVEKSIEDAREIEVSILGNDNPIASVPGEIISSNEFYDYDAKYVDGKSEAVIPAKLPSSITQKVRELAVKSFKAIDCSGMARVDFLVTHRTNKIYFNEINTIPGFTSISMYPKLWEAAGIKYPVLLDRLIRFAIERYEGKMKLETTFKPKKDWYV